MSCCTLDQKLFLTAEWRYLAMVNFSVDRALLEPFVPSGTELDSYKGITYLSLVGFLFEHTKVLGITVPFHQNFEEVNLRFYVRRKAEDGWRRGVVFIKEIVPKWAISFVARAVYNENYQTLPMHHEITYRSEQPREFPRVMYSFGVPDCALSFSLEATTPRAALVADSEEEFITEHYWGYTKQRSGKTLEYRVDHPRWKVWSSCEVKLTGDFANLYGPEFGAVLNMPPQSAFIADGSEISVYRGQRIN